MLAGQDPDLLLFALQSLSRIGHSAAAPAILPLLDHSDPNVAQAAIEAAGKLRIQAAVPALCGLLQGDLWLQLAAIAALGEIGHPDAVKPLLVFVPDSILAEPAVQALRRIAAPESLEPLLPLLLSVRERSLRDPLLLAVAVVIELHPDPEPLLRRMERDVVVDGGNLVAYLGQLLETPVEADADESDSLLRAAAAVVAAGGIAELQPVLLARLARDETALWIEGLFGRFPEPITPRLTQLLEHPDLRPGQPLGRGELPGRPAPGGARGGLPRPGTHGPRCRRSAAARAAPER
jgi:HEAT repeat protein